MRSKGCLRQIWRYGERLDGGYRAAGSTLPPTPQHQRADPALAERYAQLHAWRKARAEQRGVEADVIISRNTLWQLAREMPTTLEQLSAMQGLGPWRLEAYGAELLDLIGRLNGSG
jgi:ribonuclease D